jgi:glucose-6-phosphate dehydrogenase assembly protein OpcA
LSEDVWSARDTTPDAVDAALRGMLRELHAADEALAPARVLNLVVVVDADWKGEIANRLSRVGRYHGSRTILCAVEDGRTALDARAVIHYDEQHDGTGVMHEDVVLDIGPAHLKSLKTVIDPVIVSELATLLWTPHGHDQAVESLRDVVDVMLLDSDDLLEPAEALDRARTELETAYIVDLAWLRTTPWRERLAASFDPGSRRCQLYEISQLVIRHRPSSLSSALLLAGWLSSRLGWSVTPLASANGSGLQGSAGSVRIALEPLDQDAPGLAGVTVGCGAGFSLSLDRARGGLRARERDPDGVERTWRVLGASRGEGGILGEGVRQALLRDPTYGPALDAALELTPA